MKIYTVADLIESLQKLDHDRAVLIGDSDRYGRNDMNIGSVIKKQHGYDDSNEYYYVITIGEHKEGCIKY